MVSMRRLILLRHAKASPRGTGEDHARDLTPSGRKAAAWVGGRLREAGWVPDLALVSDASRTRETFALAAAAFPVPPTLRLEPALYDAEPRAVLKAIASVPAAVHTLLVVGHNPSIGLVARTLAPTGEPAGLARMQEGYPTAAVALIGLDIPDWSGIARTAGALDALLLPP